ncbi:hypothetical protein CHS0354_003797 [Potamilus streckersoni]|uniref:Uncharacterized protein n=1 Tax=Potamilus streckersoni TaxID=2493646 RepID=A0AAE0T3E3_9BIVA|nr:hypothetical protein CHS0354_003797 [Potamilus streckersoni]
MVFKHAYARKGLSGTLLLLSILRDYCGCHWEAWEAWSSCTESCSGAANEDGWDFERCNTNCFNGGSFVELGTLDGYCRCPTGYVGNCCETIVTCGYPGDINNGRVVGISFTYDQVVQYECIEKYNLTGYASRRCTQSGTWSDMSPTCQFAKHCVSSPCKNGATCVDGLGFYTCECVTGWTGAYCDVDIQPPVMEGCPGNLKKFVSNRISEISWPAPTFTDPMATSLIIESNYNTNISLPWGDFSVQYVATKPSNGQVTECIFHISVRPNPCDDLAAPANGILMCNGWQKDYFHICLFTCLSGYYLPQGFNYAQWYVCGQVATGFL